MAYTPVPTVSTGTLWTAADHNTYIRDNFAAGVPDLFTTKGDLAVGTGVNAAVRLGVGANGTILIADSAEASGLKWMDTVPGAFTTKGDLYAASAADVGARLAAGANGTVLEADSGQTLGLKYKASVGSSYKRTSGQTINASTLTIVDFDVAEADPDGLVTTGANWKFTAPISGWYSINAGVRLGSTAWAAGKLYYGYLYKNGAGLRRLWLKYIEAAITVGIFQAGATAVYLAATDYVDIRVFQDTLVNLNTQTGADCWVDIARIK